MTATRQPRDHFAGYDPFRLHVFVPAIMSAGLLFSLVTLLRDAVDRRGHRRAERRVAITAHATADAVLAGLSPPRALPRSHVAPRTVYALVAGVALLGSAYLVPGAVLNYLRPDGYVSDIAWLLGLSLLVGGSLVVTGLSAALVVLDWPRPRPQVHWLIEVTPGGRRGGSALVGEAGRPACAGAAPSSWSGAGVLAGVAGLTFVAVGVGVGRFGTVDRDVAEWLAALDPPSIVHTIAAIGSTPVSVLLATAIGAVAVRCRTFAAAWVTTVVATFAVDALLKSVVGRERPVGTAMTGLEDSFPSGHLAQLVLLAVAAPLALRVVASPRWMRAAVALTLAGTVVVAALDRVAGGFHWPTDVAGGALLGFVAGCALRWVVAHGEWHRRCPRRPWPSEDGGGP